MKLKISMGLLAAAVGVYAQSDFLGLPVSGYLDNVVDSAAIQRKAPYVPLPSMGAQADDERFWTKRRISLSYAYVDTVIDGDNPGTHLGVPEIYAESKYGQSFHLAGLYSDSTRDLSPGDAEAETFGVSLQSAQEVWRFLRPRDTASQLWLGCAVGYERINTDYTLPSGHSEPDQHTLFISPNITFTRGITKRLSALIIPAMTIAWANADYGKQDVDSDFGLFTLTGRADYGVTDRIVLTAFATWKQDVYMDVDGVPSSKLDCHSWAEFGGGLRAALTTDIGLRAGYSYEAFHPDFDRHKFSVRLELGF